MNNRLTIPSSPWINKVHLIMVAYTYVLMFLTLPRFCLSEIATTTVSRESESQSQSQSSLSDCHEIIQTTFFYDDTADEHRLVVNIPEKVSRKNLKIDIDYDNDGKIEFFGWWTEGGKIRGEALRKICAYDEWRVGPEFLSKEAILSADRVSIFDMVMSIQDRQLILSLPVSAWTNSATISTT